MKKSSSCKSNKANVTTEKVFNRDNFGIEGNHELNNDEKPCLRYLTVIDVYLRFSSISLALKSCRKLKIFFKQKDLEICHSTGSKGGFIVSIRRFIA